MTDVEVLPTVSTYNNYNEAGKSKVRNTILSYLLYTYLFKILIWTVINYYNRIYYIFQLRAGYL